MTTLHGQEAHEKVWSMIKDIKFALMATCDASGKMFHARPMAAVNTKEPFDGTLWFFTSADSRKADEIRANPSALLTYAEPSKQDYVSLSGMAQIIRDPSKIAALWSEPMRTWFPQGKEDPNLVLIRFDAEEAEFWDSPSSGLVYAYGYLKARLTGKTPHPGEIGHVEFTKAS